MKKIVIILFTSILLSFTTIYFTGFFNGTVIERAYHNKSVEMQSFDDSVLNSKDLAALSKFIKKRNWLFVSTKINPNASSLNYVYNYENANTDFVKCIDHFKNFRNDLLNWDTNLVFEKSEIKYKAVKAFTIFGNDITEDKVKQELKSNNLFKKMEVLDSLSSYEYTSNNYFYILLGLCVFIIVISWISYDYYLLMTKEKKFRLLKIYEYKKSVFLNEFGFKTRIVSFISIVLLSFIVLIIYYRTLNIGLLFLILISFLVAVLILILEFFVFKLIAIFIRKGKVFFLNVLMVIMLCVINVFLVYLFNTNFGFVNLSDSSNVSDNEFDKFLF